MMSSGDWPRMSPAAGSDLGDIDGGVHFRKDDELAGVGRVNAHAEVGKETGEASAQFAFFAAPERATSGCQAKSRNRKASASPSIIGAQERSPRSSSCSTGS